MSHRLKLSPVALTVWLGLSVLPMAPPVDAAEVDELSLDDLLNTRITTASKFSQRVSEAPSSVTVIRGEEIRSHGWRNLSEALVSVPGFEVSNATDYRYLGVRGFSQPGDYNSRILLLVDGIPANDSIYDQAMIGPELPLDMKLIERIEVVPGPGSALYGGNAYLAVVNIITRQSESIGRSVTLGAGSNGLAGGQASAGGRDENGRHWLISASTERSTGEARYFPQWDGVGGSDGQARGLDGERTHRLFLRYGGEDWSIHLLSGQRQRDSAGGMYATDFSAPARNTDATTQLALRFARPINQSWTFEGQAYAGDYSWEGRYRYSGVWESDKVHSDWVGGGAQLTGKPWDNQTWVLGTSIRNDFKRDQQNVGPLSEGGRRTSSLFAQDEIRFNHAITLNLGGRYDRDTLGSSQFSPRGALVVSLPAAMVLKLMAGKAFRPPNAYETSYSSPGTQLAGGNLKPERISTGEIALEQAIGAHGRWTASIYNNRFKDRLGTVTDFTTGLQQIQTVGDAHTDGFGLGVRYRFDDGLDVRSSLDWQRSKDMTGGALPNSPQRLAKLLAMVPLSAYELGWETYYTGPRCDTFGMRVGGQTVSHAALSGRFTRDLRWQVRASNLFDRRLVVVVGQEYSLGPAGNVPIIADYGRQLQINLTADF
jgi:iron complex outermembrane receptor protein